MQDLTPVARRSVPEEVADQLLGRIISGQLAAGGPLPSERELADALGVSRPTVRTALQRLSQAGLIEIRQGGGTTVRDFRQHAGLDLLPHLLVTHDGVDLAVVRDLVTVRTELGPLIAQRAARATASAGGPPDDSLVAAARAVAEADGTVGRQWASLAFWDAVIARAGSMVYRLLLNGLRAAYEPAIEALSGVMAVEVDRVEDFVAIAAAIDGGDAAAAHDRSAALLGAGLDALTALLDTLDPEQGPST